LPPRLRIGHAIARNATAPADIDKLSWLVAESIRVLAEVRTRKVKNVSFESICNTACNRNGRLTSLQRLVLCGGHVMAVAGSSEQLLQAKSSAKARATLGGDAVP
jgi:hypothetical protein